MAEQKFKPFSVKAEPQVTERTVTPLDVPVKIQTEEFEYPRIRRAGEGEYHTTRTKFGPLAATDPERVSRNRGQSRFSINPLLREPLSVEAEERRVIEEKVRVRIQTIGDEAREKAREIGYQEGLKKGQTEAFEKFRAEAAENLQKFEDLLNSFENAKSEVFSANQHFILEMVQKIARMVILKELEVDREYVNRLGKELIERVGVKENIRIKVNPEDLEIVKKLKEDLTSTTGLYKNITLIESEEVSKGGCTVETEWNAIDATIENQLQAVEQSLLGKQG